jgi:hypothetical protein
MESTITNQLCMQKLQNEIIPDVQGGGHVDETFLQQDGALPHAANVAFAVLHDVLVAVAYQIDFRGALDAGGPGHHVHRT